MKSTKVASRYAKALLELAVEQSKIESVSGDMQYLLEVCGQSRDFEILLNSPIVKADTKIAIFERVFEQFEVVSMAFVKLITKNRRENILPAIAESFGAQVKEYKGIVPVTLLTAKQLDENTKDAILSKVQPLVNGQMELEEKIDESIIGGFIVRMGDTQIDASVASQFINLKQRLTR